ncbi:putative Gluconate operon transcriptional repressor [Nostocoides japonicum T1-X7]|uniref:Putative Gluconate operon transcriptional repressor n=1 Tax=Nostocoides japonicum T1-X7 TaxID=1194083 RepID=A0A077M824_9MICO|nr:GntR family transcriptional regulator [Tetrasphaera japonica]CCH80229.1 putative Gluconate operon transcriptional repressor [Tetrasphaera japonica T1-X7]
MSTSTGLVALQRRSTADRVCDELRRLIIAGALEPGQPLHEKRVAEELGVSRSPVREALQQLVAERLLIAAEPSKTVTVREFTEDDIHEIYDARIAIERHAAATVIAGGPAKVAEASALLAAALDVLTSVLDSGDRLQIAQADLAFHQQLVRCGGNSRLIDAYLLLSAETVTCMTWLENARPSDAGLVQDHQDLIDGLETQDPDVAGRTIAQHLSRADSNLSASTAAERSTPPRPPRRDLGTGVTS